MKPERWQKIEGIYHAALEREEGQRAAFLEEACAGDEALRREVESLLAQEGTTGSFLEAPALEVAAKVMSEDSGRSLLGRQLGSYQVLSLLGTGGMGEVYRAHDRKLGREIAIKVLPKEFSQDPERLGRLEREVEARVGGGGATAAVTRVRHRRALEDCAAALARAAAARAPELVAEDLRLALRALGRITGRVDVEDVLDVIFRDFCIGK